MTKPWRNGFERRKSNRTLDIILSKQCHKEAADPNGAKLTTF